MTLGRQRVLRYSTKIMIDERKKNDKMDVFKIEMFALLKTLLRE